MSRYEIFNGKFPCHTCKEEVKNLRMYLETGQLTWMCSKNHISSVSLRAEKKSKKDYE
jgi:hypothetical protein